jgi:hypothetical protein
MDTKKSTYRRLTLIKFLGKPGGKPMVSTTTRLHEELKTTSCMKPTKVDIMSTKHEEIHEGLKLNGSGLSRANLSGDLYIEDALTLTRHKVNCY